MFLEEINKKYYLIPREEFEEVKIKLRKYQHQQLIRGKILSAEAHKEEIAERLKLRKEYKKILPKLQT
jgi:hypothetical protein